MTRTVRAYVYEADPITTFVERIDKTNEWADYYELPEDLVSAFLTAERALIEARRNVERYIADNRLTKIEVEL